MRGRLKPTQFPQFHDGVFHTVTARTVRDGRFDDVGGGNGDVGPQPGSIVVGESEFRLSSGEGEAAMLGAGEPRGARGAGLYYLGRQLVVIQGTRLALD